MLMENLIQGYDKNFTQATKGLPFHSPSCIVSHAIRLTNSVYTVILGNNFYAIKNIYNNCFPSTVYSLK